MSFATKEDLAAWLQGAVPGGDVSADLALEVASTSVATAAGVPIVEATDTDVAIDSDGGHRLLLPKYPVTDVAALTVDDVDPKGWTWSRSGILTRTGGRWWPVGDRKVVVTYTHGYAAVDIPADVNHVTLAVAARLVANPQRLQSFSGDGGGAVFGIGSDVLVTELTDPERDRVLQAIR